MIRVDQSEARDAAVSALRDGGVVLIPTDTVYGLACAPAAADAVYALKNRPPERRLPVIVGDSGQAEALGLRWTPAAERLADAFWPGALTIVAGTDEPRVDWLDGRREVAVRAPDSDLIRAVVAEFGPFFMTSANRHGVPTPASLDAALASIDGLPAVAIDGGTLDVVASTVVNVAGPDPVIEREGAVPGEAVREVLERG